MKYNVYNIVQVVHGVYFTRDTKLFSDTTFGLEQDLIDFIPYYYRAYYHRGTWKSEKVSSEADFSVVRRVEQQRIYRNQYYQLKNIQYINAVHHSGTPVPPPLIIDPLTYASRRHAEDYRLYRISLAAKQQIKYKVFKYIYP